MSEPFEGRQGAGDGNAAAGAEPATGMRLRLQRLLHLSPCTVAYWDRDLRCRYANPTLARWYGVSIEQLLGLSMVEITGPVIHALNEPHVRAALRGEHQWFERVYPCADGESLPGLVQYIPDVVDGAVQGFMSLGMEISAVKRGEVALRESELRFRALAEASPFAVLRSKTEGTLTYASPQWLAMTGLNADPSHGRPWWQLVHPEDAAEVRAAWCTAAAQSSEFDCEFRLIRADGAERRLRMRARPEAPVPGGEGLPGYVGAAEDVTDQWRVQQRLRTSESFLARAGRVAAVGGWELDLVTQELLWSPETRHIHEVPPGYRPSVAAAIGFYAAPARPLIEAAIDEALQHGTPWDLELPLVTATGREIRVRASGEVEWDGGVPVRLIGAFKDITDEHQRRVDLQREQALRLQLERHAEGLDRLLREREAMLDVMAHEVRQPLNNASAALQSAALVLAGMGEQDASRRLRRAQAVMTQVMASIDNTLAVAALLARPDPIQREDTDVDTLLAVAVADLPSADRGRVRIERASAARSVSMDMSLMRLALRNLLSNAVKYSPPGTPVTVRLSDSDTPAALRIDVCDAGPGIDEDLQSRMFERSSHVRRIDDPGQRGLGLGLYIVRRVMELHGGRAELAANGPGGATLRLLLPDGGG